MKTRTIMAAVIAAILIVICGGSAIHYLLDNMPVVFNDPALELAVRTGLGISDRPITRLSAPASGSQTARSPAKKPGKSSPWTSPSWRDTQKKSQI